MSTMLNPFFLDDPRYVDHGTVMDEACHGQVYHSTYPTWPPADSFTSYNATDNYHYAHAATAMHSHSQDWSFRASSTQWQPYTPPNETSTIDQSFYEPMPGSPRSISPEQLLSNHPTWNEIAIEEQVPQRACAPTPISQAPCYSETRQPTATDVLHDVGRDSSPSASVSTTYSGSQVRGHDSTREASVAEDSDAFESDSHWRCQTCKKHFKRGYNLKDHMRSHDVARKYDHKCPYEGCDKAFSRKADLRRHDASVHQKAKEYSCPMCKAGFTRKDTAKRHITDGCALRENFVRRRGKRTQLDKTPRKSPLHNKMAFVYEN